MLFAATGTGVTVPGLVAVGVIAALLGLGWLVRSGRLVKDSPDEEDQAWGDWRTRAALAVTESHLDLIENPPIDLRGDVDLREEEESDADVSLDAPSPGAEIEKPL